MTAMVSNQQHVLQPISSPDLLEIFKAMAPRSFEKTFEGIPTRAINYSMKICIDGLTREQINMGLAQVRDNGFCPDLSMFRKWCLGITGFGTDQQRLQDSFKGKHAALANIVKWRKDSKQSITNAEKDAYDRCYEMFEEIVWAKNADRAMYLAYEAFKDNYADVVKDFSEKGVSQTTWEKPKAVTNKPVVLDIKPNSMLPEQTPEQKAWIEGRTKELQAESMSFPMALMQAGRELKSAGGGV